MMFRIDGTDEELAGLEERYKLDNGEYPLKIDYAAFIREIEQVFTQKVKRLGDDNLLGTRKRPNCEAPRISGTCRNQTATN